MFLWKIYVDIFKQILLIRKHKHTLVRKKRRQTTTILDVWETHAKAPIFIFLHTQTHTEILTHNNTHAQTHTRTRTRTSAHYCTQQTHAKTQNANTKRTRGHTKHLDTSVLCGHTNGQYFTDLQFLPLSMANLSYNIWNGLWCSDFWIYTKTKRWLYNLKNVKTF